MQYLGALSTEWSPFVSKQTIQYHINPDLCPNQQCWRSWMVLWWPTRPSKTNNNSKKRCPFHHRWLECKSRSREIPRVIGKFGLGEKNEAGQRLTEFWQENTLVITNTFCQQHKRSLYTWTSPDGQYWNQIDYIFCSQRWISSIQSAKTTRPGDDCGSAQRCLCTSQECS